MKTPELGYWLQRFFREHLASQRNVSQATIRAYRDTFRLFLRYWRTKHRRCPDSLSLDILTPEAVLEFLDHLERQRDNCIRTRNARLAAIRSFVHYLVDWLESDLPPSAPKILGLPFKRCAQSIKGFLSRQEIEAILNATDDTWTGRRDHLLFLLLYNTGARISEILSLRVKDVSADAKQITILGKGRKHRNVPIWRQSQTRLRRWIRDNQYSAEAPLLPNRFGQRLTRAGAAHQLRRLVHRASAQVPTLAKRRVSPHSFRHWIAMHLLEKGVPTEIIALLLGHETPKTTHLYIEASLAMKKRVLETVSPPKSKRTRFRPDDELISFLEDL